MIKRIYEEPREITEEEVFDAIEQDDIERLIRIPIRLGFHHENWKFIQDISIRLTEHPNANVRANAFLGIHYAARFRGRIEKNVVKPVLLRGLRDPDPSVAMRAQDTIDEVNHLLKWNIGGARRQKNIEKRYEQRHPRNTEQAGGCDGEKPAS